MLWQQQSTMEPTHAVIDARGNSPYLTLGEYLSERHQSGEKQHHKLLHTLTELEASDLDTESESEDDGENSLSLSMSSSSTSSTTHLDEASQLNTDFSAYSGPAPAPTLVTLPPEIRHEILKHLLVMPTTTSSDAEDSSHKTYTQQPGLLHPAILRTSRLLYAEAQPLLYRANTFLAHNTLLTDLPQIQRAYRPVLDEEAAAQIDRFRVNVRLDAEPGYDAATAAKHLSSREEVTLEVTTFSEGSSGLEVLRLFEGVRGVRRAKVVGGEALTGFEEYARWLEQAMMSPVGAEVEPFVSEEETREESEEAQESSETQTSFTAQSTASWTAQSGWSWN